jgi:hypothetical protein
MSGTNEICFTNRVLNTRNESVVFFVTLGEAVTALDSIYRSVGNDFEILVCLTILKQP